MGCKGALPRCVNNFLRPGGTWYQQMTPPKSKRPPHPVAKVLFQTEILRAPQQTIVQNGITCSPHGSNGCAEIWFFSSNDGTWS
eukprot:scaffold14836_cov134-Cylindrotheca_fusiformis.AAC.5